jgi:hypothetical protein
VSENGKKNDAPLIMALATGFSVAESARRAGFGERTVYRRLAEPAFRAQVVEARAQMFSQAVGRLADLAGKAVDTLGELLDSENEGVRLQASKAVLELGPRIRESVDLAAEVADLKRRLEEGEDGDRAPAGCGENSAVAE